MIEFFSLHWYENYAQMKKTNSILQTKSVNLTHGELRSMFSSSVFISI